MMLFCGIYLAPYFTIATRTPKHILAASVILLTVFGSYAIRGNIFDVYVMITFGIIGYLMRSCGFSAMPTVLGIILGTQAEKGLYGTLAISEGQNVVWFILQRPISLILIFLTIVSISIPVFRYWRQKNKPN